MLNVYFDWNIIARYRDYHLKDDSSALNYGIIREWINRNQIATYFSDAHILDIQSIPEQSQYTDIDLKAISQITGDRYLAYDSIHKYWGFQTKHPAKVFDHLRDNFRFQSDFDSILEDYGILGGVIKEILSSIRLPNSDQVIDERLPTDLYGYMQHLFFQNNEAISSSRFYRARRNKYVDLLNKHKPYKSILSEKNEDKLIVFIRLYKTLSEVAPKLIEDRPTHILAVFWLLDQVHLWTDEKLKNLQVDAMHTFYASHSSTQYLITNDKNMIGKSQLAYLRLGLPIEVLSFSDFSTLLSKS